MLSVLCGRGQRQHLLLTPPSVIGGCRISLNYALRIRETKDLGSAMVIFALFQVTEAAYQSSKHTEGTYSLTTLIPSDRAEPIMHLTTVSMEEFLNLKHSSWPLTWAISYTALTDTIPAVSWPSHTKDFRLERQNKLKTKNSVQLYLIL